MSPAPARTSTRRDPQRRPRHPRGGRPRRGRHEPRRRTASASAARRSTSTSRTAPRSSARSPTAVTADLARHAVARPSRRTTRGRTSRATAHAYRAFVHANPNGYGLLFAHLAPELQPDPVEPRRARPADRRGDDAARRVRTTRCRPRARSWRGRTGSSAWSSPARSGSAASSTWPTPRDRDDPRRASADGRRPASGVTTKRMRKRPTTSTRAPRSCGCAFCTRASPGLPGPGPGRSMASIDALRPRACRIADENDDQAAGMLAMTIIATSEIRMMARTAAPSEVAGARRHVGSGSFDRSVVRAVRAVQDGDRLSCRQAARS